MAASRSDMYLLSQDATFQNRVRAAMISAAVAIKNEAITVSFHREREAYCVGILNSPDAYKALLAGSVATDTTVIADATQAGTVVLTGANVAAQAALVTDAHMDSAISSQFNSFFRTPGF